jgi:hypothetical protein
VATASSAVTAGGGFTVGSVEASRLGRQGGGMSSTGVEPRCVTLDGGDLARPASLRSVAKGGANSEDVYVGDEVDPCGGWNAQGSWGDPGS